MYSIYKSKQILEHVNNSPKSRRYWLNQSWRIGSCSKVRSLASFQLQKFFLKKNWSNQSSQQNKPPKKPYFPVRFFFPQCGKKSFKIGSYTCRNLPKISMQNLILKNLLKYTHFGDSWNKSLFCPWRLSNAVYGFIKYQSENHRKNS